MQELFRPTRTKHLARCTGPPYTVRVDYAATPGAMDGSAPTDTVKR
jgi:hypothetical protein